MILKGIVAGGEGSSWRCLGLFGVVLVLGRHGAGLEQEGGVGHISFLLG